MNYASTVERLMNGSIDFHLHADPDPFHERRLDVLELALQAKEAGMKAVVAKCHHFATAPLTYLVNKIVSGFTLVGSLTLDSEVGGLSPEVVEVAAKTGARVIWMPTSSSMVDRDRMESRPTKRGSPEGISLIDEENNLLPPVISILEIIKENDLVQGTGHVSVREIYMVTSEANRMGIKLTITHPLNSCFGSTLSLG